jgi:hypothetical protein
MEPPVRKTTCPWQHDAAQDQQDQHEEQVNEMKHASVVLNRQLPQFDLAEWHFWVRPGEMSDLQPKVKVWRAAKAIAARAQCNRGLKRPLVFQDGPAYDDL